MGFAKMDLCICLVARKKYEKIRKVADTILKSMLSVGSLNIPVNNSHFKGSLCSL